jgi:hypothetical protein
MKREIVRTAMGFLSRDHGEKFNFLPPDSTSPGILSY